MVSPGCTVIAVPPSQFQLRWLAPAAPGGGSAALCTLAWRCGWLTEPVTSLAELLERKKLLSKRCVSELQLTAATEIVARTARRNQRSERKGSTTRRIGFPTRTQQDEEGVNNAPVNKFLSLQ